MRNTVWTRDGWSLVTQLYRLRVLSPVYLPGATVRRKGPLSHTGIAGDRMPRAVPRSVSRCVTPRRTCSLSSSSLEDMKAEDIVTIDLNGKTSIADHMVVASGRSNRHVGAVADDVVEHLKKIRR